MKLFIQVAKEQVANDSCAEEQCDFQAFIIFELNAVQVRLHDCQLFQTGEHGHSDVAFLALLGLLARGVC